MSFGGLGNMMGGSTADQWKQVTHDLQQGPEGPTYSHGNRPGWQDDVNFEEEEEDQPEPREQLDPIAKAMERAAMEQRAQKRVAEGYDKGAGLKDEGAAAFKKKQFAEAVKLWGEALRSVDSFGSNTHLAAEREELRIALHNNRAVAQIQLRNYAAAEADTKDVLFAQPDNLKALFRRGQARLGRKNFAGAAEDLGRVVEAKPGDKKAAKALAEAREGVASRPASVDTAEGDGPVQHDMLGRPQSAGRSESNPDPRECVGGMAFMRAQQQLGALTLDELYIALELEVGQAAAAAAGKYHSSALAALSESLIEQGRESGDAAEATQRATSIVVQALTARVGETLARPAAVADLVRVRKLRSQCRAQKSAIEQWPALEQRQKDLLEQAQTELADMQSSTDIVALDTRLDEVRQWGWDELRPLSKAYYAAGDHLKALQRAVLEEEDRKERAALAEKAAQEKAQREAKHEGEKALYAGRYAEAAEKLSEALEMLPESTMYAADRKLLTLSRDRAVTRRDEEAAKDAARAARRAEDERKSAEVAAHMESLRKSLTETRARLGQVVNANNAKNEAMLKLPFEGLEGLKAAGGHPVTVSDSRYQVGSTDAPWVRVPVDKIRTHAMTYGKLSDWRDVAPQLGEAEVGEAVLVADRGMSCGESHVVLLTRASIEALAAANPEAGILEAGQGSDDAGGKASGEPEPEPEQEPEPAPAVNGYGTVPVDLAAEQATLKALRKQQMDRPPPVAMKRNPETGEMEEFHSDALKDDLPEEETEQAEIELPCGGDDY